MAGETTNAAEGPAERGMGADLGVGRGNGKPERWSWVDTNVGDGYEPSSSPLDYFQVRSIFIFVILNFYQK